LIKIKEIFVLLLLRVAGRIADPHHLNVEPVPSFNFTANPDSNFHFNADPDPIFHLNQCGSGFCAASEAIVFPKDSVFIYVSDPNYIRSVDPDPESESGSRRAKMTHKKN
jgi:hypothetical protein